MPKQNVTCEKRVSRHNAKRQTSKWPKLAWKVVQCGPVAPWPTPLRRTCRTSQQNYVHLLLRSKHWSEQVGRRVWMATLMLTDDKIGDKTIGWTKGPGCYRYWQDTWSMARYRVSGSSIPLIQGMASYITVEQVCINIGRQHVLCVKCCIWIDYCAIVQNHKSVACHLIRLKIN